MNTLNKLVIIIIITLAAIPIIAQQYGNFGSTNTTGRGPTVMFFPLIAHLEAATTKQIENNARPGSLVYVPALYTMVSTGTKFGTAMQSVSGVSAGTMISYCSDVGQRSTMSCFAIMYWVYRDTYSATVAQEAFTWGGSQTGGGALIGCLGDLDEVVAAQNITAGFAYNPNGTGYDFFQGTCPIRNDGKWHHVIQVIDRYGEKMKQFVDGVKDFNSITMGLEHTITKLTAPSNLYLDFCIGSYASIASKFQGRFDEWCVVVTSSRSMSDNEYYEFYRASAGRHAP